VEPIERPEKFGSLESTPVIASKIRNNFEMSFNKIKKLSFILL